MSLGFQRAGYTVTHGITGSLFDAQTFTGNTGAPATACALDDVEATATALANVIGGIEFDGVFVGYPGADELDRFVRLVSKFIAQFIIFPASTHPARPGSARQAVAGLEQAGYLVDTVTMDPDFYAVRRERDHTFVVAAAPPFDPAIVTGAIMRDQSGDETQVCSGSSPISLAEVMACALTRATD